MVCCLKVLLGCSRLRDAEGNYGRFRRFSFREICANPDKIPLPRGHSDIVGKLNIGPVRPALPNQIPLRCHNENFVVSGSLHFMPTEIQLFSGD